MTSSKPQTQDAGAFLEWLTTTRKAMQDHSGSNVACGACTGCCSSSYFIHVRAHEQASLKKIPKAMLVAAPGWPVGDKLMGYDKHGHCPMLKQQQCQIYQDRPQTCRDYDCRIFTATGLSAGGKEKSQINQRVADWRFTYPTADDRAAQQALLASRTFIQKHADCFPGGRVPQDPTQLALLAIKVYPVFLKQAPGHLNAQDLSQLALQIIACAREFDQAILPLAQTKLN